MAAAAVFAIIPLSAEADGPVVERDITETIEVVQDRCLRRTELVPAVATWLKRDRLDARIRVVVRYEGDAIAYAFFLGDTFVGKRWFRELAQACPDVIQTLSLAMAVAIEANFLSAPADEKTGGPARPERRAPKPRPRKSAAPLPVPARSGAPRWSLAVGPLVMWKVLPVFAWGGSVSAEMEWSRHVETRMSFFLSAPGDVPLPVGKASTQLFAFRADICFALDIIQIRARACGGFANGIVTSKASGLLVDRSRLFPWSAAAVRVDGSLILKRWGAPPNASAAGVFTAVDAFVPVRRPSLIVDHESGGEVDRIDFPVVGVAPAAGAFFMFP